MIKKDIFHDHNKIRFIHLNKIYRSRILVSNSHTQFTTLSNRRITLLYQFIIIKLNLILIYENKKPLLL